MKNLKICLKISKIIFTIQKTPKRSSRGGGTDRRMRCANWFQPIGVRCKETSSQHPIRFGAGFIWPRYSWFCWLWSGGHGYSFMWLRRPMSRDLQNAPESYHCSSFDKDGNEAGSLSGSERDLCRAYWYQSRPVNAVIATEAPNFLWEYELTKKPVLS